MRRNDLWLIRKGDKLHPVNLRETTMNLSREIRQIGVKRVLYGSDVPPSGNLRPKESWAEMSKPGLSEKEIKTIAGNREPYLR